MNQGGMFDRVRRYMPKHNELFEEDSVGLRTEENLRRSVQLAFD